MHKMNIDPASDEDANALCNLFNEARKTNPSFPRARYSLAEFSEAVKGEKILVARIHGEIAGFASVWEPETFLHHLYVAPRYQRNGIGRALVHSCVKEFGLPMSLKCIKANLDACRFYESLGWQAKEEANSPEGVYVLFVLPEDRQ